MLSFTLSASIRLKQKLQINQEYILSYRKTPLDRHKMQIPSQIVFLDLPKLLHDDLLYTISS